MATADLFTGGSSSLPFDEEGLGEEGKKLRSGGRTLRPENNTRSMGYRALHGRNRRIGVSKTLN